MLVTRDRLRFATFVAVLTAAAAAHAQTDYFWNNTGLAATSGGSGTWDTFTPNWDTSTDPTIVNNYIWTNSGSERANFGNVGTSAGTVTLGVPITAYGINFSQANYVITNGGVGANTLTLSGTGGVINSNVAATINAQIAGNVGLTKTGSGALTLNAANTYSGTTTVTGGTLLGVTQASGSPFSSGPITLNDASLQLKAVTGSLTTTTNVGDLTIGAANTTTVGVSQLTVDNTLAGGSATTTFAAGNLVRGGFGSALVITPVGSALGTADIVTLSNGNSLLTNGILPPWVVTSTGTGPADYVTYGGSGVTVANYSSTDITTSTNSSVVDQSSAPTITGNVTAYALKNSATIDLTGHALTLGNGSGQSGLILNGGSIINGNISFGSTEGVVYSGGTTTLGSTGTTISSNGLTITALGATNMTINGNIQNGTSASQVTFTGVTSGTSLTLNGANGYTGGTILSVNTGSTGNVFIGNDSAFGTGKVTNIIVPGTSSDQIQAINGDHTLANPFDLNGGMTFTGSNSLTFTGPITEINAAAGGARTLQNSITATGKTITFGSAGSPSTITLGNPVSNGGDGVGKQLLFTANVGIASATSTFVINDVLQDPAAGGGTASGSVQYGSTGSTGGKGLYQINSQSTYSGTTTLNGNNQVTIQYATDTVGPSSNITKGPFGTGTLLFNNTSNDTMQPVGGGTRIISNPITLNFGYTFASATGDTTSAMFTGPIAMLTAGRTLTNNLAGATLTLGDLANPTTLTLPTASGTTTAIAGTGNNTTVNDVIQEVPGSGNLSNVTISAGGTNVTVLMNAMNTYAGNTNFTGGGTIVPIVNSTNGSPGAIVAGPFGTGTLNFNNGTNQHMRPTGGDKTIANAVTMTTGFAMDNSTGDQSNLTFSGPINMTNNNGRTISNGFSGQTNVGGTLFVGDPNSPNVITLGDFTNPTGSASLGFGAWTGPIVVNDTIVDPFTVTKPFTVSVGPNTQSYPVLFNAANTYTGGFTVTGTSTSAIELGTDTVGEAGSISSGPLGV
ncbi:MAG TPA: autotransporter-associated beta strand repeat-containing protein, partial [Lacipirellulaceae bacterium]|nr:autotransporter-associated beta strand repeat-containing protein [Lacipirellulaceae bacterium]